MMKQQLQFLIYTLLVTAALFSSGCNCNPLSGLGSSKVAGSIEEPTDALSSPVSLDLVLDQMSFSKTALEGGSGNIVIFDEAKAHESLEIEILDEEGSTLLACAGSQQSELKMTKIGFANLIYGQIDATFQTSQGNLFTDDMPVMVRLVSRHNRYCPDGYNSESRVFASTQTTFGKLYTDGVTFKDYGHASFRHQSDAAKAVEPTTSKSGGNLAVDQIFVTDNEGLEKADTNMPDLAVLLKDTEVDIPLACSELHGVDDADIQYGNLQYEFISVIDESTVNAGFLNSKKTYVLELVELDSAHCEDFVVRPFQIDQTTFGLTDELSADDLLSGTDIPFKNDDGWVRVYLK